MHSIQLLHIPRQLASLSAGRGCIRNQYCTKCKMQPQLELLMASYCSSGALQV